MATYYVFTLEGGAQLHAGPTSSVKMASGDAKSPDQIQVGDRISHVAGCHATVTQIDTVEV